MRASRVKKFFRDQHFFSSYVSRGLARAQFCIDGTAGSFAWPRCAVNPRSPEGRAGRREGLTAKARAEQQWCPAITLANVTAFFLIPLFPLRFRLRLFNRSKAEPFCFCDTRRINLYPVGASPVPRSLLQQCEGTGLQGRMGPFCIAASFSHAEYRSHIQPWNWNQLEFTSSPSAILISPSEWRLQAPCRSRDSARARSAACVRRRRS